MILIDWRIACIQKVFISLLLQWWSQRLAEIHPAARLDHTCVRLPHSLDFGGRVPVEEKCVGVGVSSPSDSRLRRLFSIILAHAKMVAGRSRFHFLGFALVCAPLIVLNGLVRILLYDLRRLKCTVLAVGQGNSLLVLPKVVLEARARHWADNLLCQYSPVVVRKAIIVLHQDHHLIPSIHRI